MSDRNYWLNLFTWETWQEFLKHGGEISGFREARRKMVNRIKEGDYFLCYLTGVSRFIGILEVTSEPFEDSTPIWGLDTFPCRLNVKVIAALEPDTAVPVHDLRGQLSVFENLSSPHAWTGHFRGSPARWKKTDGRAVVQAVLEAQENPITRPVDPAKLKSRPRAIKTKIGTVTIPEGEAEVNKHLNDKTKPNEHTKIQWLLLKLGSDMGLDIWAATNDKGKSYKGKPFSSLPRTKSELPLQFDEVTNRTIELIDVLWLAGNSIVAAFEIESTTSIYSGLLRMADLIAMQPNLNIPLFLVAPDQRRDKVYSQINRPTFSRLSPPMNQMCRYISFSALEDKINQVKDVVRHLKPEFLEDVSESCEPEDD